MLILLLLSNSIGSKKNLINLINVFVMKKHYGHFIVFHPQSNQTAPPNMHHSLPFQYQSKKAVLHLNHTIQLYTKSNTTMPQPQNVTNNIQAAQNMRDTIQYHAWGIPEQKLACIFRHHVQIPELPSTG